MAEHVPPESAGPRDEGGDGAAVGLTGSHSPLLGESTDVDMSDHKGKRKRDTKQALGVGAEDFDDDDDDAWDDHEPGARLSDRREERDSMVIDVKGKSKIHSVLDPEEYQEKLLGTVSVLEPFQSVFREAAYRNRPPGFRSYDDFPLDHGFRALYAHMQQSTMRSSPGYSQSLHQCVSLLKSLWILQAIERTLELKSREPHNSVQLMKERREAQILAKMIDQELSRPDLVAWPKNDILILPHTSFSIWTTAVEVLEDLNASSNDEEVIFPVVALARPSRYSNRRRGVLPKFRRNPNREKDALEFAIARTENQQTIFRTTQLEYNQEYELMVFRDTRASPGTGVTITRFHKRSDNGGLGKPETQSFDGSRDRVAPLYVVGDSLTLWEIEVQNQEDEQAKLYRFNNLHEIFRFQWALTCFKVSYHLQGVKWDASTPLMRRPSGVNSGIQIWIWDPHDELEALTEAMESQRYKDDSSSSISHLTSQSSSTSSGVGFSPDSTEPGGIRSQMKQTNTEAVVLPCKPLIVIFSGSGCFCIQLSETLYADETSCKCWKNPPICRRTVIKDASGDLTMLSEKKGINEPPNLAIYIGLFGKERPDRPGLYDKFGVQQIRSKHLVLDFPSVAAREKFHLLFGMAQKMLTHQIFAQKTSEAAAVDSMSNFKSHGNLRQPELDRKNVPLLQQGLKSSSILNPAILRIHKLGMYYFVRLLNRDKKFESSCRQIAEKLPEQEFIDLQSALLEQFANELEKIIRDSDSNSKSDIVITTWLSTSAARKGISYTLYEMCSPAETLKPGYGNKEHVPGEKAEVTGSHSFASNYGKETEFFSESYVRDRLLNIGLIRKESSELGHLEDETVESLIGRMKPPYLSPMAFEYAVEFLTATPPFGTYKSRLDGYHRLLTQRIDANTLSEAIVGGDISIGVWLVREHFDEVAQQEFEWLHELREMGYDARDIVNLLCEDQTDAPWIYFERDSKFPLEVKLNFHRTGCLHRERPKLIAGEEAPTNASLSLDSNAARKDSPHDMDFGKNLTAQFTGLGGVTPTSKNLENWTGRVLFDLSGSRTGSITYEKNDTSGASLLQIVQQTGRVLEDLIFLFARLQESHLCCDSFTILVLSEAPIIDVVKIDFALVLAFKERLELGLPLWKEPGAEDGHSFPFKISSALGAILTEITKLFGFTDAVVEALRQKSYLDETLTEELTDAIALTSQLLCLGLLSYSRAHLGPIHPFFLDRSLAAINILGKRTDVGHAHGSLELFRLTCLNGLFKSSVLAFRSNRVKLPNAACFDLCCSPEDFIDTWGPGQIIRTHPSGKDTDLDAIKIGGGFISYQPESSKLHWQRGLRKLDEDLVTFDISGKYLIGAVSHNTGCPLDENEVLEKSASLLNNLGTSADYFKLIERELHMQAGQYFSLQFANTWIKNEGITVKDRNLDASSIAIPFLSSPWGLQISLCTGAAQRISLLDLLSQVMPAYVEACLPIPRGWNELLHRHHLLDLLRSPDFATQLQNLDEDMQALTCKLIRYVLEVLRPTGIDMAYKELVIAWPLKQDPFRCLRVRCDRSNFWTRILADSEHCATFAFITTKCLETNAHKCRQSQNSAWNNVTAALDTAVCYHQSHRDRALPGSNWTLASQAAYWIGKPGMDLKARVVQPMNVTRPWLTVYRSKIPEYIQLRMGRKIHRIRERQCLDPGAKEVLITACIE